MGKSMRVDSGEFTFELVDVHRGNKHCGPINVSSSGFLEIKLMH